MKVLMGLADRLLAGVVPEADAGACNEYYKCVRGRQKICYFGCGRPVFCRFTGRSC